MIATIRKHFTWPDITKDITQYVATCKEFHMAKQTAPKEYGKIPMASNVVTEPWEEIHVDMIGEWKVKFMNTDTGKMETRKVHALMCIDHSTGFPKLITCLLKPSAEISRLFLIGWLYRHPRPHTVVHDNVGEFMGYEFQQVLYKWGINVKPTTVNNPRANSAI